MIRYSLLCDRGHEFEGWFGSAKAYDAQSRRGHVVCPDCGSSKVSKAPMAPNLAPRRDGGSGRIAPTSGEREMQALARKMREHVEKNADYVGERFPEEARKIHYEEVEPRGIYGEASPQEAKALRDEGVEVHPLPGLPDEQN